MLNETADGRAMLRGDVAIARGAFEAGVALVTSYPGAPISGIVQAFMESGDSSIVARWATNEKVALEEAFGASLAGRRAMAVVKNVGLNVAMDALVTIAYVGCRGGLVLVVGDDPGGIGSATEQDSRFALRMVETLVLEPSTPQESKDMTREAFHLSEELELPVVIRTCARVCEMSASVELGEAEESRAPAGFKSVPWHWSTGMGTTVERHSWLRNKQAHIARLVGSTPFNRREDGGGRLGVVSSGMAYNYVSEAVKRLGLQGEVPVLKTGTYPVPKDALMELLETVERLLVVEELGPFIELEVLSLRPRGCTAQALGRLTGTFPEVGELSTDLVAEAISGLTGWDGSAGRSRGRVATASGQSFPRKLCPGCPHISTLSAMQRAVEELGYDRYVAPADAGCVGLGVFPPVEAVHVNICMGSSIGIATGLVEAGIEEPVFAVTGDSAFFHTGLPSLVNAVRHNVKVTVIVCDNAGAAMTGLQPSPTTADEAEGACRVVSIKEAALGCGVRFAEERDAKDSEGTVECIKRAVAHPGPAVVVARGPCVKERTAG